MEPVSLFNTINSDSTSIYVSSKITLTTVSALDGAYV